MNESGLELLSNLNFCVFDLETTGGNLQSDKIIEIGLVRIEKLKIVEEKSYLIRPEIQIPDFIQKLTSIKQEDVISAPIIEEVIDDILLFMSDSILVAHNTAFDVPFLNSVLRRLGRPELTNKALCTNIMTKYMIPNILSSNLNYMSKIFQLGDHKAHRALDDARITAHLLIKFLQVFIDKGLNKVNNIYYPKNKFELDRFHYKKGQSLDDQSFFDKISHISSPFTITFKGPEGIILNSLPLHPTKEEILFVQENMKLLPWETISVKLSGPYIQGLLECLNSINKMPEKERKEMISTLLRFNPQVEKVELASYKISALADFLIVNHLIPQQYVVYPLECLHQKSELVFRFPGHRNKLNQYLNSKSSRLENGKMKKDNTTPEVISFLYSYLSWEKSNPTECYLFEKNFHRKHSEQFITGLEAYIEKNKNNYNFPQFYL